jgi:hypothetical protein
MESDGTALVFMSVSAVAAHSKEAVCSLRLSIPEARDLASRLTANADSAEALLAKAGESKQVAPPVLGILCRQCLLRNVESARCHWATPVCFECLPQKQQPQATKK